MTIESWLRDVILQNNLDIFLNLAKKYSNKKDFNAVVSRQMHKEGSFTYLNFQQTI